uniref:Amine oxidase domain-containing protein n=1 Tax=Clastoptera arizonana TaxID=38151 RepID=A0A1B6C6C4_9HEMI
MAGLAAARSLLEAGISNIAILEAQNRAGGRVFSLPIKMINPQEGLYLKHIELGAQWIHGEDNPVFRFSDQKNLLSSVNSDEGQGPYLRPNGSEIPTAIVHEVSGIIGTLLEKCEAFINMADCVPVSVGDYLQNEFQMYLESCDDPPNVRQDKEDLFNWHKRYLVIDNSCDNINCLSAKAWGHYQFTGGQDYINLKNGYSSLINSLTDEFPEDILKLNSPVLLIDWSKYHSIDHLNIDDKTIFNENSNQNYKRCESNYSDIGCLCNKGFSVVLTCKDNVQYHTDHVIVTSSIGFLKQNFKSFFKPPLPQILQKVSYIKQ